MGDVFSFRRVIDCFRGLGGGGRHVADRIAESVCLLKLLPSVALLSDPGGRGVQGGVLRGDEVMRQLEFLSGNSLGILRSVSSGLAARRGVLTFCGAQGGSLLGSLSLRGIVRVLSSMGGDGGSVGEGSIGASPSSISSRGNGNSGGSSAKINLVLSGGRRIVRSVVGGVSRRFRG